MIVDQATKSQFRCSGPDGYLAWLTDTNGIRAADDTMLDPTGYDFHFVDDPNELHRQLEMERRNKATNRSRVVAGWCRQWPSRKKPDAWGIEIPGLVHRNGRIETDTTKRAWSDKTIRRLKARLNRP